MTINKLSIAIIIDSIQIYAWQYAMLEQIKEDNNDIDLIIINNSHYKSTSIAQNIIKALTKNINYKAIGILSKIPVLRSGIGVFKDALSQKNITDLLGNTKTICITQEKNQSIVIEQLDKHIANNSTNKLDLIIDLSRGISYDPLIKYSRYGIWKYQYGIENKNWILADGKYESLTYKSETAFTLKVYLEDINKGIEVYKETFSTHPIPHCNTNNLLWAAVPVLPRHLKNLKQMGFTEYVTKLNNTLENIYTQGSEVHPIKYFIPIIYVRNYIKYIINVLTRKLFYYQWSVLLINRDNRNDLMGNKNIIQVAPAMDRFWADPFVITDNNYIYIFVEEEMRENKKGHITVLKLDNEGKLLEALPIIKKDYHMSYPFILRYDNKMYMIPESSQDNSIKLYKCEEFPQKWALVKTILPNIKAVDTSLIYYNKLWWLFCSQCSEDGMQNRLLYLYYSSDLLSDEWIPHPLNPIVNDIKCGRNAGRIFVENEELYRPAQDCSKNYGYGIKIKKIITLSKTDYKEIEIYSINSDMIKEIHGIHTINMDKQFTVIDVLKRVPRFVNSSKSYKLTESHLSLIRDKFINEIY